MGELPSREGFCQLTGLCLVKHLGEFQSAELSYAKMGSKLEQRSNAGHRKRLRGQGWKIKEGKPEGLGTTRGSFEEKTSLKTMPLRVRPERALRRREISNTLLYSTALCEP